MSYGLNSIKGGYIGDPMGDYFKVDQGGYEEERLWLTLLAALLMTRRVRWIISSFEHMGLYSTFI